MCGRLADPVVTRIALRQWRSDLGTLKDLLKAEVGGGAP